MFVVDPPPDPEWYIDHVLAVVGPHGELGPARQRQGDWLAARNELLRSTAGSDLERASKLACRQGFALRVDQARDCGLTDSRIRWLLQRGRWSRPRHGVLSPLPPEPIEPARSSSARTVQPHGLAPQVRAAAAALTRPGTVVSDECAATMHGLPLVESVSRPTLMAMRLARLVDRRDVIVRGVGFKADETTTWMGTTVTDVARTVVDLARHLGTTAGLVAADAALTDRLTTEHLLADARRRASFRPGVRAMDRVLDLCRYGSESALESLTRACLVDGGLPAPELQIWIDTPHGRFRVDMLYRHQQVIVEADGELKYRGDATALVREKRRQEALEQAGYLVVRVSWWEVLHRPHEVVQRVLAAFARSLHGAA